MVENHKEEENGNTNWIIGDSDIGVLRPGH